MSHWMLSLVLLALAALPFAILWRLRKSGQDGWLYLLASISILLVTAALLVWAPDAYVALGGTTFFPKLDDDAGGFDTQSYSGFLQVLFGVPVAVAGSLYAILLARQSERQSNQFNRYEIRKNFRDRLDQRNAAVGRFAKALRDINNTSFVIVAQVERVIASLPDDEAGRDQSVLNIRKETARIEDDGLAMLRTALDDYRNAAIAVRENNITLARKPNSPLDAIESHFFSRGIAPQEFVSSLLQRDYQAIADRMTIRAFRLSATDLVRAHLERMAQAVVRWSHASPEQIGTLAIRDAVLAGSDITSANVSGVADNLGFRFIGPALMRADGRRDAWDRWTGRKLPFRVDLGTAVLIDSSLSIPGSKDSLPDLETWEEWRFLQQFIDDTPEDHLLNLVPEWDHYFPKAFCAEVEAMRQLYSYPLNPKSPESRELTRKARVEYSALFYHMPPDWLDALYDRLAESITGDAPLARQELVDNLACIAVGIESAKMSYARQASIEAIQHIVTSMNGAVERQFLKLGPAGHREYRRCLLVSWTMEASTERRRTTLTRLNELATLSGDLVLTVQLQLDLFDCHSALGEHEEARQHFKRASALVAGLEPEQLALTPWFGVFYKYPFTDLPLEPQAVLLALWIEGVLMKWPGDFMFGGQVVSETEIAMVNGFLPSIWAVLVVTGFIQLPGGAKPTLVHCPNDCFLERMIKPGQGEWQWDPAALSKELARRLDNARQGHQSIFMDQVYDEFASLQSDRLQVEAWPHG